jgi:hypothetical protein
MGLAMIRRMPRQFPARAPRVTVPEGSFATIQLENGRQIPTKLRRVSITGGLLDLAIFIEERLAVGLTLPIGSGVVHARAELLFPMRTMIGYLQPFRFTSIREEQLHILDREISELLKQTRIVQGVPKDLGVSPPNFLLERW